MHHVVLFAAYSGGLGGAERLLLDFASGLETEICVACPEGQLADAARSSGVRVFPIRARDLNFRASRIDRVLAPLRIAGHGLELSRLVRDLDPDVVVAWGMRSALASMAPGVRGRPLVFHHNDLLPDPGIATIVRASAARARVVTVPSRTVAEDLDPTGRLGRRLAVVPPGVDVGWFSRADNPVNPPEVLVLGALVGWKRPDLALEAFALLRGRHPEARLRLVGGPVTPGDPLPQRLRTRAERSDLAGSVEFVGAVRDPRAELSRATALLHCAPREPFGIAVLEALAAGRPAVVPSAGGPAEIVDESCAVLYPPGDARAAAEALSSLLSDPGLAARMGERGRERARARFDRGAARRRFADALAPLIARRPPRAAAAGVADQLTLVTVTRNSAHELDALLASVARHVPGVRVVVVDCASSDQTLEIAARSPTAVAVPLAENVGFGRASNRGVEEVRTPVTVLVNPDVELLDDSLLALAAEAARIDRPERLLAPLVLRPDGSRQDSVHPAPGSPPALLHAIFPPALVRPHLGLASAPWKASRPRRVGWAVGCALAAKTATLRALGPFDQRIFLYGEDFELGLRAADAGVQTWFWPHARVLHHGAHSTSSAFGGEPFELLAGQRRAAIASTLGPGWARLDDAAQAITFGSRIVMKRAVGRGAGREQRQLEALLRGRRSET